MPVVLLDFKKMYQTIFILQQIQELLASKELVFIEDTESVRRFVDTITLDMLFEKSIWPKLRAICWVLPAGEIFQTTARFPGQKIFTSGMVPRYSDKPVPYFLAEVVLAKLSSGRVPKIVRAERIFGKGRQALRKIEMPGGGIFDPRTDDFFKFNVEYGERMKRGDGIDLSKRVRDALISGIKCIGNTGAYGIYAETNEADLPGDETEKVDLLSDEIVVPGVRLAHPESPGPFCCPPLAGLITAGARLLLGMAHREVLDRGGNIAFGDTDSLAIVATETGKLFATDNLYRVNPLSWREVGEIVDRFSALNPYDPKLIPGSILEIKAGGDVQLAALALSSKRYCLTLPDGSFPSDEARKESVLGMLLSPLAGAPGDDRQEASHRWIDEAWRVIGRIWDGEAPSDPWLALPAVRRIANSTPEINRKNIRSLNRDLAGEPLPLAEQCRPFNFFLAATAMNTDGETRPVLAPFERDPSKWAGLDWRVAETGNVVAIGDTGGWRLKTIGEFLKNYAAHRSPEWLDATGLPSGPNSRGVMQRMPVRDGERWLRTKESLTWSDDPAHAFETRGPAEFCLGDHIGDNRETFWREPLLPAMRALGAVPVARAMRIGPRTVQRWLYGKQRPSHEEIARLARTLFSMAVDARLFTDNESGDSVGFQPERIDYAAMIALIPERVAALREFVMRSAAGLVEAYGGRRPLAAAMSRAGPKFAVSERTIRGWLCDKTLTCDVEALNEISEKLARFLRRASVQFSVTEAMTRF